MELLGNVVAEKNFMVKKESKNEPYKVKKEKRLFLD